MGSAKFTDNSTYLFKYWPLSLNKCPREGENAHCSTNIRTNRVKLYNDKQLELAGHLWAIGWPLDSPPRIRHHRRRPLERFDSICPSTGAERLPISLTTSQKTEVYDVQPIRRKTGGCYPASPSRPLQPARSGSSTSRQDRSGLWVSKQGRLRYANERCLPNRRPLASTTAARPPQFAKSHAYEVW